MTVLDLHTTPSLDTDGQFHDLRLSNSKLGTWRRCPYKYQYKYVRQLRSKRKARPLELGTWMHELLEHWYGAMIPGQESHYDWRQVHRDRTKKFNNLFDVEKEDLGDLPVDALRIFKGYLRRYGLEDRKRWKVIDVELDEIITLPNGLRFQIIIDLVIEEPDGGLWIVDHKNVGKFMDPDFMLLDAQLARYFWGAEHMGYGPLRGIMFNQINTSKRVTPKTLTDGTLEKRSNTSCDPYTYMDLCKKMGIRMDGQTKAFVQKLLRRRDEWWLRSRLPKDPPLIERLMEELYIGAEEIVYAEQDNKFARTVRKDCTWDCEFKIPCQLELLGGDADNFLKSHFTDKRKEADL